jgi:hypothetical protein
MTGVIVCDKAYPVSLSSLPKLVQNRTHFKDTACTRLFSVTVLHKYVCFTAKHCLKTSLTLHFYGTTLHFYSRSTANNGKRTAYPQKTQERVRFCEAGGDGRWSQAVPDCVGCREFGEHRTGHQARHPDDQSLGGASGGGLHSHFPELRECPVSASEEKSSQGTKHYPHGAKNGSQADHPGKPTQPNAQTTRPTSSPTRGRGRRDQSHQGVQEDHRASFSRAAGEEVGRLCRKASRKPNATEHPTVARR